MFLSIANHFKSCQSTHKIKFIVFGAIDNTCSSHLKSMLNESIACKNVTFEGYIQSSLIYRQLSAVIIPTLYSEGVPRVALEASACGRPVVCSSAPGLNELIQDGVNGFVIPEQDVRLYISVYGS